MKAFWPDKLSVFTERQLLGAGQYGLVYRVFNPDLQQFTAVKIVEVVQDINQIIIKRFNREIKSLQKVNSPKVVKLINFWLEPGFVAFEMEYIHGISLEKLIKKLAPLPYLKKQEIIINIIYQICKGLEDIHRADLVHRDIKPSNILLQIEGINENWSGGEILNYLNKNDFVVKISDLGLVKDLCVSLSITRTSDFIGTAAYVSPEQAIGSKITAATDLYSLGVIWYEMISGKNPFHKKTIYKTINAHIKEEPPHIQSMISQISLDLAHVLMLLLQKDPTQRFYTSQRLLLMLKQRQEQTEDGDFDISLLLTPLNKTQKKHHGFNNFINTIQNKKENSHIFIAKYSNLIAKRRAVSYLFQNKDSTDFQAIRFLSDFHPDFLYSFIHSIYNQLSDLDRDRFKTEIASNSLLLNTMELFSLKNIYQQIDYVRNKFQKIPINIRIYSSMQLIIDLLLFLSKKKPILFVIDGLENGFPVFKTFFITILTRLKDAPVFWLITLPEKHYQNISQEISGYIFINKINLDDFFLELNTDIMHKDEINADIWEECSFHHKSENLPIIKKEATVKLNQNEKNFLEYFALSGYSNSIEFINWLLINHFNKNGEIILSLIKKNILHNSSDFHESQQLVFRSRNFYRRILNKLDYKEKKRKLESLVSFYENTKDLTNLEILMGLLWDLNKFSRFAHIAVDLIEFYHVINDFRSIKIHLSVIPNLKKNYKIPATLNIRVQTSQLLYKAYFENDKKVVEHAKKLYHKISDKYKEEKGLLIFIIVFSSLKIGDAQTIEEFQKISQEAKTITETAKINLDLLFGIHLFLNNNIDKALIIISETLMKLNQINFYWDIPTGSYLIAKIYKEKKESEKAYQYAALGFQAGKALNDFWIMNRCLDLMETNSYYQNNRHQLINWNLVREKLFDFPVSLLEKLDYRAGLF